MPMRRAAIRGTVSKYRAVKTTVDGHTFHSKKEAKRYGELKLLERLGMIRNLEVQPRYVLTVRGVKIGEYRGDFRYLECVDGQVFTVCEDVKSPPTKTPIYRWKKRHLLAEHGVEIKEV